MKAMQMSRRLSAFVLAFLLVFANVPALAANETKAPSITFENVSDDGKDMITFTDERTFEAVVELGDVSEEEAAALAESVAWSLSREKGIQDESKFPYQFLGGALSDWKVWSTEEPLFTAETTAEGNTLKLTLKNTYFFGSDRVDSPRGNRNVILDYVGDYDLTCTDAEGKMLGQTTVRVNPYDSYHTNAEFYDDLAAANAVIAARGDMYSEIRSMGTSTDGYDMQYMIIADSKKTIEKYEAMTEIAETDPQSLIDQIKAGTLDYKFPILYSNVHADENPGSDAPMNFIWDLAESDKNGNVIEYKNLTGFTEAGKAQFDKEMDERNVHWSKLLEDWPTGLGFIQDGNGTSGVIDLDKYYTSETVSLDVGKLLDDVFFIVVPEENVDARTYNIRQNGNGFDLNRDNMFQTQQETINMTKMVAHWNPVTFIELHGFIGAFQVEPCSPPHEPNIEYDLLAENAFKAGEAFGIAAIANNDSFNSYVMPLRDYLTEDDKGVPYWAEPWDDMSTNYTPQYSLLHGTVAYTIEVPKANEDATIALEYGLIGHAAYVAEHKDEFYINQLTGYLRGLNNEDNAEVSKWYVDMYDNIGAEADVYRPKYEENNNFFPECYIIPVDRYSQKDISAAYEMQEFLLRNDVKVHTLKQDVTIDGKTYKAGSFVVSMYQAKRNVANGALYDGVLITGWTDLYSEPITAFSQTRGFTCDAIAVKGAVTDDMLKEVTSPIKAKTSFTGKKDGAVIISNSSVDAVAAVNALLDMGEGVGMVTEGLYIGDYVTSYKSFQKLGDEFVVTATGVSDTPIAQTIEKPTLYIPGAKAEFSSVNGQNYGVKGYQNYGNTNYNFDRIAYGRDMGFTITTDVNEADIIIGNRALDDAAVAAVKNGTPYIAAGENALETIKTELLAGTGFDYVSTGSNQDALFFVTYESNSLITKSYVIDKDNLMYGYGGAFIKSVPAGAQVLIRATKDEPLEGFFMEENLKQFLGSIQVFEYEANGMDLTVFANSLTSKGHQQDDYRYAANAIFSKMLGNKFSVH